MTKKNFCTLVFGIVGTLVFGVGICMCLLPAWNALRPGVAVAAVGAAELMVLAVWRWIRDGRKAPRPNWRLVGKIAFGTLGALVLGLGMCMVLVWETLLAGVAVGLVGIALLLCLIPMCVGLK